MSRARLFQILAGAAILVVIAALTAFLRLPPAPGPAAPVAVPAAETARTIAALGPRGRARPVIAVIGLNDATETTDYLMPTSILRRADIGEVWTLAPDPGPVRLYPALTVLPDATTAAFDARHPEGADYVIVPAMNPDDDPAVLAWIRRQAAKGAIIVGVCAGARVVANADLLDGRTGTTHWFYLRGLRQAHPDFHYLRDRRFVVDDGVATTTGISASIPMSLTLIEAIAGRTKARDVARTLGVDHWDARHDSAAFRFNRRFAGQVLANTIRVWSRETLAIELDPRQDPVALALTADAWSRTYRSRVVSHATTDAPVLIGGFRFVADRTGTPRARIVSPPAAPVMQGLDQTLAAIGARYGAGTADIVAMQLEYAFRSRRGVQNVAPDDRPRSHRTPTESSPT